MQYVCGADSAGALLRGGNLELIAGETPSGYTAARVDTRGLGIKPGMQGPEGAAYNTIALEWRIKLPAMGEPSCRHMCCCCGVGGSVEANV